MAPIVTPHVVSVEERTCVTMWLVTAPMDVNHIGRDNGVTVRNIVLLIAYITYVCKQIV